LVWMSVSQATNPDASLATSGIAPSATKSSSTQAPEGALPSLFAHADSTAIGYEVYETRNASYDSCVRIIADVVMDNGGFVSDSDLLTVAHKVVLEILTQTDVNAIGVFFWQPGSGVGQGQAAASVDWAPNGRWSSADEVTIGDYSTHAFRVDFNRTAEYSQSELQTSDETLSVSKQREIFYNLVALQDRISMDDYRYQEKNQQAKVTIAQQYGISMETLGTIIMEGARNGWPMPPPP